MIFYALAFFMISIYGCRNEDDESSSETVTNPLPVDPTNKDKPVSDTCPNRGGKNPSQLGNPKSKKSISTLSSEPIFKQFDRKIVQFWKSHLTTKDSRTSWFERMISMYDKNGKGEYFARKYSSMYNFLSDTFGNEVEFARLESESRLIYPADRSIDDVVHTLIWRVPGYAGSLVSSWFDENKFANVYENVGQADNDMRKQAAKILQPSDRNLHHDPMIRYALLDRVDRAYAYGILSATKVYRNEPPTSDTHWIHVLHIWGVNLESESTQDWNKLAQPNIKNGALNVPCLVEAYKVRMIEMFAVIKRSIVETANVLIGKYPDVKTLNVWIPGIGLNNFLKALGTYDPEAMNGCILAFLKVMNDNVFSKSDAEILASANQDVKDRVSAGTFALTLRFVEYSGLPNVARTHASELSSIVTATHDSGPRSYIHGSLFNYDRTLPNQYFLLVNAWDPMTFIGNGGSRDPSMDGWFVGGYTHGNFACTAWLSNLHMIPSLIEHMIPADLP